METEKIDNSIPPEIIIFSGDTAEWESYQESLFKIFSETLIKESLRFQGLPVNPRRWPEYKGKHYTFWHIISEGEKEEERVPNLRRCERISWISWIVKNCENNPDISYWESSRRGSKNFVLWYEKGEFAVILAKRSKYFVLLSAYAIIEKHKIESFKRERDNYKKSSPKS